VEDESDWHKSYVGAYNRGMNHTCFAVTAVSAVALLVSQAAGQLTPDRTYFGVDRPVPMTVVVPAGSTGDPVIEIFMPGSKEAKATAPVAAGSINLASLFPTLWSEKSESVQYAQLKVGDTRIGSPVVLQPLLDSPPARGGQGRPTFPPRQGAYSGIRAYSDKFVEFTTTVGTITFRLRPDQAPNTVWNFRSLIEGGFYTDIVFHRIMGSQPGKPGFMAQVGDPTGTGSGGPGYNIDLENSKLPHDFGVISMARTGDPNTNGSQVFVCFSREGTNFLDGSYCAFGQAVGGADAIVKLDQTPTETSPSGESSKPKDPAPRITSAKMVDAPPFGQEPAAVKAAEAPKAER